MNNFFSPVLKWTLVDRQYLPPSPSPLDRQTWHTFLSKLGVKDFLCVRKEEVHLEQHELVSTRFLCIMFGVVFILHYLVGIVFHIKKKKREKCYSLQFVSLKKTAALKVTLILSSRIIRLNRILEN